MIKPTTLRNSLQGAPAPAYRSHSPIPTLVTFIGVVAVLYLAREVFLPIAIALLLTFALAPVVSALRRLRMPRVVAVLVTVLVTFCVIGVFSLIVALQVGELARHLPTYQSNIVTKIKTLKEGGEENGIIDRITRTIERINKEMGRPKVDVETGREPPPEDPLLVEIYSPDNPVEVLTNLVMPLFAPLAMTGLVVVVVIFMLLEREDLRDRFIRLVGFSDLHRTTEALQDAARRVGHYLLMQLIVNVTYGIPIAAGLWIIGIPNAILWGLLAIVLRFVPYVGPIIAMMLPLILSVAIAPGWSLLLWTAGLFTVMELLINNVVEPLLYGSRTGLSPLAIIVSAIFWAWIWGAVGLVLSTPLTVCLVVLGKHVPQFAFLHVLFGSDPVLEPHARLYQRLLAGDPVEPTDQAEEILEKEYLVDYYANVAIPALVLAEHDRARGVMDKEQLLLVSATALTLVSNLEDSAAEEMDGDEPEKQDTEGEEAGDAVKEELPDGAGRSILCIGGRGEIDDVSAAMLAQVLRVEGADAKAASFTAIAPANIGKLGSTEVETIVVCFLNEDSLRHAKYVVRRLKRAKGAVRLGIVLWMDPEEDAEAGSARLKEAEAELNADFVKGDMVSAAIAALTRAAPVSRSAPRKAKARRRLPISSEVPEGAQ
ncbi:AI-2E family transporter [Rhizobium sp. Root482]|uniref:AI-2E family transporter n=1 Tax=Rhizobium sp. Root482 TaxID=1736543 RepID=UPI0009E7CDEC|nr:AI-2E family transporter [Rhizobium sp. Root482]